MRLIVGGSEQDPPREVALSFGAADGAGTARSAESAGSAGSAESAESAPESSEPRILRVWASIELGAASVVLVVVFVSVLWQVVSRYIPSLNWPGVGELANYSLVVLTFIMVGYLIGKNGHIMIKIVDYLVKGRAFMVVRVVSALCVAVICGLLAYEAYGLILAFPSRRTAALQIPVWLLYLVPLVGFASGTLRAVVNIFLAGKPESTFDAAEAK